MASYVVKPGDSLSIIARDVIGDLSRWPELAMLNQLSSPYIIEPGQVLQLPADVTVPARSTSTVTRAPAPTRSSVTPVPAAEPWYRKPWFWMAVAGGLLLLESMAGEKPKARRRGRV